MPVLYFADFILLKFAESHSLGWVPSRAFESSSILLLIFLFECLAVGCFQKIELPHRLPVVHFLAPHFAQHKHNEVRGLLANLIVEVRQIPDEFEEFAIIDMVQFLLSQTTLKVGSGEGIVVYLLIEQHEVHYPVDFQIV